MKFKASSGTRNYGTISTVRFSIRGESAALGHFSISIFFGQVDNKESKNKYSTLGEFLREILYKNIAIIAIQHSKFILLSPLVIFLILLGVIHLSPSGKFPYTY